MRSQLSDNKGERVDLGSVKFGVSRPAQLSADYTIPDDGPVMHFLDPGAADRTVTLPAFKRGACYGITHIGAASSLNVVDSDASAIVTLSNVQGAIFVCSGYEWKYFALTSTNTLEVTEVSSPDSSITVTVTSAHAIEIEVSEPNVDHDLLFNYVADEHVAHSSVTITGDSANGVTGGGDISASRTLALDFSGMSTISPAVTDLLALYDVSGLTMGRMTITSLNSILLLTGLADYDPNKLVDHTAVSMQAGEGLTGGGTIASTRTFAIDLDGLPTTTPTTTDEIMFYDVSGLSLNKLTFASMISSFNILQSSDIGVSVQAYDADLQTLANKGFSVSGNRFDVAGYITSGGIFEGGLAIDFHNSDADITDFAVRLSTNVTTSDLYIIPAGGSAHIIYRDGGTDVPVADGGTGASDAATARTNLGLAIGTDVEAYDAGLASIAGLVTAADEMLYLTALDTYATATLTAAGRALLDDASASAQRTTLGLGSAATLDVGTSANNVVQLNGSAQLPAVDGSLLTGLSSGSSTPRGHIAGLTLSTAGSSTTFSIAVGEAVDTAVAVLMQLTSAYSKTTGSWAVGSTNGALDTGTIAASTWYHVFLIRRSDTGVVDVLISLSATSPTMPASYDAKRRIGSLLTDGSSNWTAFHQYGEHFIWDTPVNDSTTIPTSTASNYTISVPTGVVVEPIISCDDETGSSIGPFEFIVNDPNVTATTPTDDGTNPTLSLFGHRKSTSGDTIGSGFAGGNIFTNTSAQVQIIANGTSQYFTLNTFGWIDQRGRFD